MRKITVFTALFLFIASICLAGEIWIDGNEYDRVEVLQYEGLDDASLSPAGKANMYYDSDDNKLMISKNGGAYAEVGSGSGTTSDSKWEEVSGTLQPLTQSNNVSIANNLTVSTINGVSPVTGYTLDFVAEQGAITDKNLTISGAGVKTFVVQSTDHDRVGFHFVRGVVGDVYYDIFIGNDSGYTQILKEPFTANEEVLLQFEDGTDDLQIPSSDVSINKSMTIIGQLWVGGSLYSGGGLFTDGGGVTYLTSVTDDLALGSTGATEAAAAYFDVSEGDLSVSNNLTVGNKVYAGTLAGTGTGAISFTGDADFNNSVTVDSILWLSSLGALRDNGGGDLEFTENNGGTWTDFGSGGLANIVEDTTPQIVAGGFLDMNGAYLTDVAADGVDIKDDLSVGVNLTVVGLTQINGRKLRTNTNSITNTIFGMDSFLNSDAYTSLVNSTIVGYQAGWGLSSNDADDNTFIGYRAGMNNNSGTANTLVGSGAGYNGTTNNYRTMIGYQAGYNAANGANYDTFIGYKAGAATAGGYAGGSSSTIVGYQSGLVIQDADYCTFLGANTGDAVTSGDKNTFIGYDAGTAVNSGSDNIYIGYRCADNATTGSNNTIIGEWDTPAVGSSNYVNFDNMLIGYKTTKDLTLGNCLSSDGVKVTMNNDVYVSNDISVGNILWLSPLTALRDNGAAGDAEFTEDNGGTWTDFGAGGGLANVVEDITPQLGGELDCNGKGIIDATDSVDVKDDLSVGNNLTVVNISWIHDARITDATLSGDIYVNADDVQITGLLTINNVNYVPYDVGLAFNMSDSSVNVSWTNLQIQGLSATARDLTLSMNLTGALGHDSGEKEAASTWYEIYAIAAPLSTTDNISIMANTAGSSVTLPNQYTLKRLIGYAYNDAASNVRRCRSYNGEDFWYDTQAKNTVLSDGAATTWTAVSLSTYLPPKAYVAYVNLLITCDSGLASIWTEFKSGWGNGKEGWVYSGISETKSYVYNTPFTLSTDISQGIYYQGSNAAQNTSIYVSGYKFKSK